MMKPPSLSGIPPLGLSRLPVVTGEQMLLVDRVMVQDLGVSMLQMMENAGRSMAVLIMTLYQPRRVLVIAGHGGNGGGGLAAARHLHNHGVGVEVALSPSAPRMPEVARQGGIARAIGIEVVDLPPKGQYDLVIDAVLGYAFRDEPRDFPEWALQWMSGQRCPIVAVDVPSGFDAQGGRFHSRAVWADVTMTIAAPKLNLVGSPQAGSVYLADIGVPGWVWSACLGQSAGLAPSIAQLDVPWPAGHWLVKIEPGN